MNICRFSALDELTQRDKRDYEKVKEVVLRVGKFSCFEVDNHLARNIEKLLRDPEIEVIDLGYPWTGIRKKINLTEVRG